ncbi:hypothetical protein [Phycicoccus sp. 3266]|uniref:hypothetical protein n=1 Tax=Phycicoccus sp. 3266 TaxID=2817751 RepID=UPI00285EE058|nr:hypothetical protein [Phycicoccus sp. 3266]MDR6863377.1 hypothetical protein [Phycicoccus sp. 3266]
MEPLADVLLLHAVQAWCEDCGAEQLLLPVDDEGHPGLCCSVCDAAVFLLPAESVAPQVLRHTA